MAMQVLDEQGNPLDVSEDQLKQLQGQRWVCDYATHRIMWEAHAILRLADDALDQNAEEYSELSQFAMQGAMRLLAMNIERTGWQPGGQSGEG